MAKGCQGELAWHPCAKASSSSRIERERVIVEQGSQMKLYRLSIMVQEPSDETEDKYLAEIPALPGCRAWGDTSAEALENLQSLAAAFIESYRDSGDPLPPQIEAVASENDEPRIPSELLVAV